ncbi:MAG TPA: hypothetical protein VF981_14640 [Gemmatimonadaceae bacterium]
MPLPGALDRELPRGGLGVPWQWLFPATRRWPSDSAGKRGRHHLDPSAVQRAMGAGLRRSGIGKRATCHPRRHSFAPQLLESGNGIRTVRAVRGTAM